MQNEIWYPYAQIQNLPAQLEVVRAEGVTLHLADGRELIDAISSWWSVIHGYGHPELNAAAKGQIDRMAHVMLGGLTHQPAQQLAEKLVAITPTGLNHVFFADSGSVGVEVALKMSLQYWKNTDHPQKEKFVALRNAYHGDSLGSMSVCDPVDSMHSQFSGLLQRNYFLDAPDNANLSSDIETMEKFISDHHRELAGFIVEPLLQAAGGFNMYSPEYLRAARAVCDQCDVLLLFDEVATGFGRTGSLFAADQAGISPDIMVLGKALTAGYFGHSATLATTRVFEGFYGDDYSCAFMHGPTFMGNATICAIALKSIEIFEREDYLARIARIESLLNQNLKRIRSEHIKDIRVLGATGVVEVFEPVSLSGIQDFAADHRVWLRPFGGCVYTMPAYVIADEQLMKIITVIDQWFQLER